MRGVSVKRMILVGGMAVATAGLAGCGSGQEKPVAAATTGPRAVPVTVAPVQVRSVERSIPVTGTLRGWEQVAIGSKRAGRIVKVLHDIGDRVDPGAVLVELETADANLAVTQAESQYLAELVKLGLSRQQAEDFVKQYGITEELIRGELADRAIKAVPAVVERRVAMEKTQTDLTRQRQLFQRGVVSTEELQDYENVYRTAQATYDNAIVTARTVVASALAARVALDVAKQNLEDMTIRAPVPSAPPTGFEGAVRYAVTQRPVSEGQMLQSGEQVMSLVVEDPLRLWVKAPERYIGQIAVGQPARVRVSSYADETFQGQVTRLNPSVDEASRTFQVEVLVPNREGKLRPGGFAETDIVVDNEDKALVVPREAIAELAGVTKLFVVEQGVARAIPVRKGVEGSGWVEVLGEVPPDATVVTTGQVALALLADGTAVTIRTPETPSEAKAAAAPKAEPAEPKARAGASER